MPERIEEAVPTAEQKDHKREELKKNLEWFVENDDMEGLVNFVERMAHYDPLTNILNRRGFFAGAQPIQEHIARLTEGLDRRTGEYVSFNVLFMDIDRFKAINDAHGHSAGDAALQKAAEVLKEVLREDDIIGRYGGEEFVVAFTCSSKKSLIQRNRFLVAEKVRRALEEADFTYDGKRIPLTASIGVAQMQAGEDDLAGLVRRADDAMYRAKDGGRNRVVVAEEP